MSVGVLLTNLGTPDAPTPAAVRKYLAEFLNDPRVIKIPRFIWWPLLYGVILPLRGSKSAKLYQKIWTEKGSPLRVILEEQVEKLQDHRKDIHVEGAMRYGNPSIQIALEKCNRNQIKKLIILPLYPQYSFTTTESTLDEITRVCKMLNYHPEFHVIKNYYHHENYISAIAKNIQNYWQQKERTQLLVFSFHGLPQKFVEEGDPYQQQCQETAKLIAYRLNLEIDQWLVTFQSRLGKAKWLQPYTDQTLKALPEKGIKKITVVCPGFPADCLETLEEIDQLNRENFLQAGGEMFQYVPALNTSDAHMEMMMKLIEPYI